MASLAANSDSSRAAGLTGEARTRLLEAAARVFARHGAAGATTKRIAEVAGVNEVTLFRIFGSKDALLDAALQACAHGEQPARLPNTPIDPEQELTEWCAQEVARLARSSDFWRQCMAESGSRRHHADDAGTVLSASASIVRAYVDRLASQMPLVSVPEREAAVSMLVAAVVSDALARDELPVFHSLSRDRAPACYSRAFLRSIGWPVSSTFDGATTVGRMRWEWFSPPESESDTKAVGDDIDAIAERAAVWSE
ncbi:MAG TPA: TetR/AcrR family transcriptional regulator [Gemmatimonas aurantiaca]|uniref:TetR family transcriptional regulator n=2 Tax=Gemmatimonas aurantiaca TaxID=173480 RepID=C1ABN6_GEMAT|nr:TetR/AcrR family transcriptional regulator [Gemmatimonas aurantiaca]BAH39913.1 TetR family transcriptional regulator [Gemmatimonas aurantiaca T-27]HCT58076.1 TetR/AcrR family transcriptional regulator [Gemmatimonas aurantiaca]